jgi:CubicO group peptidase (beta-lactamase class C family)
MPAAAGFDPDRLDRAFALVERWVASDAVPAATLCVGRRDGGLPPRFFGRQHPDRPGPLRPDALFLVASITKPVTATAVMLLVERGQLALHDRVADVVPAFALGGKQDVTVLHLLTHTSGLPDMLPENERLRREHRPLATFIDEICRLELAFPAGTQVSYQSMGTAMLGEIVRQVSGTPLPEFLRRELFEPLGMTDTSLGYRPEQRDRIAVLRVPPAEAGRADWSWNSAYWLGFGAPWGGLITSPADLARLCRLMLGGGSVDGVRLLSPATVRTMTTNQLAVQPDVPEADRRCKPWGLGWRLNWPGQPDSFGDLVGRRAYGHWGATGTLCWLDPDADLFFILFTTQPLEGNMRRFARLSNAVAAAVR